MSDDTSVTTGDLARIADRLDSLRSVVLFMAVLLCVVVGLMVVVIAAA